MRYFPFDFPAVHEILGECSFFIYFIYFTFFIYLFLFIYFILLFEHIAQFCLSMVCLSLNFRVFWAYYKTRSTWTRSNGTRNTGRTVEHPGIVAEQQNIPEHQRNTSGTPRNNGALYDEEQLHLCVDYKRKFKKHLESTLKKAGWNVNVFLRILPCENFERNPHIHELFLRHSCFFTIAL